MPSVNWRGDVPGNIAGLLDGDAIVAHCEGEHCPAAYARYFQAGASANHRALAFYSKNGFVRIAVRDFRVGDRDYDDTVLAKSLD